MQILQAHPEFFLEACRVNIQVLNNSPNWRLNFDVDAYKFYLSSTKATPKHRRGANAEPLSPVTSLTAIHALPQMTKETKEELWNKYDLECRKNQFTFYTNKFIVDAMCKVVA